MSDLHNMTQAEAIENLRSYAFIVQQDRCISESESERLWAEVDASINRLIQPVEPVGRLTVTSKDFGIQTLRVDDGTAYVVSTALPPGEYLIVEADDE